MLVIDPAAADIATEHLAASTEELTSLDDDHIPIRPLSGRLVSTIDDLVWGMSKLIIADPRRLEDPEIARSPSEQKQKWCATTPN